MRILVFNFGSTSSKVAVFEDEKELFTKTVNHDQEFLRIHKIPADQYDVRKTDIFKALEDNGFKLEDFDAVCSRAGLIRQVESGTYEINEQCVADAKDMELGGVQPHGLALVIANDIHKEYGIPAYFCDPVSTDELEPVARVTGYKPMVRRSRFHALNQKAVARKCAEAIGRPYEELNLIGVHMGGGVSVAAHSKGRCIDITDCSEDGCFSMDRPGDLPLLSVVDFCMDSGYDKKEIKRIFKQDSGMFSYTGTKDMREVETMIEEGNEEAKLAFEAMAYQHAKSVGAMAAVLKFKVDGIFLTGGIIYDKKMVDTLKSYFGDLAPIYEFPGENEMESLAMGALRVLRGEAEPKVYTK